jgi:4-hydroxy-2-oxoheptanedioate aldolase
MRATGEADGPRARMGRGEKLTGTFVQSHDPGQMEFLGGLGFDLVCVEGEHSAMGIESIQSLLAAAALAPVPALVRISGNDPIAIAGALDSGAAGVIVPRVDDADAAAAAVAATRYPPVGERGLGPSRATGFGVRIPEYLASANEDLLLAVQVETRAAVDALAEILTVEGVDMIFVGPGDLGCSLGIADPKDPELRGIVESILTRTRGAGRLAGVWAANAEDAARWREVGAELVILGSDLIWLARGVRETLADLGAHDARVPTG